MDKDNGSFEQQFKQRMALDSKAAGFKKKRNNEKRWIFGGLLGLTILLLVIMIVFFVAYLNRPVERTARVTELMGLYERLEDRVTYGELMKMIGELSPKASIMFDDGIYIISMNDEDAPDYITCNIELSIDDDSSSEGSVEVSESEDNAEDDAIDLDELINAIMSEDESTWCENEVSKEPAVNLYDSNWEPAAATVMTYFTYYYFDELEVADDETELTELYIRQNLNGDGYELFDGWNTIAVSTKTLAVDELSRIVSQ